MALIALPVDTANLRVEPLFDDELWFVGRKGDPQLKAKAVHVTPLLTERLLLLEEGHCLRDHSLHACGASTHRSTEGVEATSLLTLVQMVDSGLGVALVPEMAVKSGLTERLNLVARPMVKPSPKRTIALVTRRSTTRLAELKALGEVIQMVSRRLDS
jgi:LysR family hydrogen peroxide-inducible transcriptional activator